MSQEIINKLMAVRDQKAAGTCLAFATSTAHEYCTALKEFLSPAYLYGIAANDDAGLDGKNGLTIPTVRTLLSAKGQVLETVSPYESWLTSLEYPKVKQSSEKHFPSKLIALGNSFDELIKCLQGHIPVILGLRISDSFRYPLADGYIDDIDTSDIGGHAVLAVGLSEKAGVTSIMIRNSWGSQWGQAGHAFLTKSYIEHRLKESAIIER